MLSSAAAIWSAIAASFAAFSSFLVMRIQRRTLLESIRPELVLNGWSRRAEGQGDAAHEVIAFQTLSNVGRGAAFQIMITITPNIIANRPASVPLLSPILIPILAVDKTNDLKNGGIIVYWKNVTPDSQGLNRLSMTVEISCWDSRGTRQRHATRYDLFVVELSQNLLGMTEIAPGVALMNRTTVARFGWLPKVREAMKELLRKLRILYFVVGSIWAVLGGVFLIAHAKGLNSNPDWGTFILACPVPLAVIPLIYWLLPNRWKPDKKNKSTTSTSTEGPR
jgi:hypothetical protein